MKLNQLLEAPRPGWVSSESREVVKLLKTLKVAVSCSAMRLNKSGDEWMFTIGIELPKDHFLPEEIYIRGIIKALVSWLHKKAESGRYIRVITRFNWITREPGAGIHVQPEDDVNYLTRLLYDTKFQFVTSPFSVNVTMTAPRQ
jgi:hypothetical protein